jgi:hypothetical protein
MRQPGFAFGYAVASPLPGFAVSSPGFPVPGSAVSSPRLPGFAFGYAVASLLQGLAQCLTPQASSRAAYMLGSCCLSSALTNG